MKVENETSESNRFLHFSEVPTDKLSKVAEIIVEVKYRDNRRSDGENAYVLDHQIIPAIIEAINAYKPKPKRDPRWPALAKAAVAAVARRMDSFTTDDVWEELAGVEGGDPRSIGAIMDACQSDGLIETTVVHVKSRRRECHGRPVRVWSSLVLKRK